MSSQTEHRDSRSTAAHRGFSSVIAAASIVSAVVAYAVLLAAPDKQSASRAPVRAEAARPAPDMNRSTAAQSGAAEVAPSAATTNTIAPPEVRAPKAQAAEAVGGDDGGVSGLPPPPNDNCTSCTPLATGQTVTGSTIGATGNGQSSCGGTSDRLDVWFCWTPQCDGIASINLCGSQFDTTLAVYDGCALTHAPTELACDDDGCSPTPGPFPSRLTMQVNAGQTYYIRVAGFNEATGLYALRVELTCDEACCFPTGECRDGPRSSCLEINGTPQGPGTICDVNTRCAGPNTGGCCAGDQCQIMPLSACIAENGKYLGDGVPCRPDVCLGQCCMRDALCAYTTPEKCFNEGGILWNVFDNCDPNDCPKTGACCAPSGGCLETSESICVGNDGRYMGDGTSCSPTICAPPTEACCFTGGGCQDMSRGACLERLGTPQGPGTSCATVVCQPPPQACCVPDGRCLDIEPRICDIEFQGTPQGPGTSCATVVCPQPKEACCLPNGGCVVVPRSQCLEGRGWPQGSGSLCLGDGNGDRIDDACAARPCEECGPGPHWIHNPPCPPGGGGQDTLSSGAYAGIDTNGDCIADTNLVLGGPVTIRKKGPADDSVQYPGLRPIDDHLDVIDTEIVSMYLTDGGMTLIAGAGMGDISLPPSFGAIAETVGDSLVADSFFDVFFEVRYGVGLNAYNQVPLRVATRIECLPPDSLYAHITGCIPLYSSPVPGQGLHLANLVSANHFTYPDCCFGTQCQKDVPTLVCQQEGGKIVPDCLGDSNGNAIDDACEELCEPTPDGSGCRQAICTNRIELCQPRCVTFNPATGQTAVRACDCAGTSECHVAIAPETVPTCAGGCGLPDVCVEQRTANPDGTFTLCCDCGPEPTEACCKDGVCGDRPRPLCLEAGGIPQGPGTTCADPGVCLPTGACCNVDGCFITDRATCTSGNARYLGDGTVCTPTTCQPPTGACCADGCFITDRDTCNAAGGPYLGDDTVCTEPLCQPNTPCDECGPGPHWVDQCHAGGDLVPTGALVGISTNPDLCDPNMNLVLNGPVSISRSAPRDDSAQFPGLRPVDGHLDVIDTEILGMTLTGGGVTLRAGAGTSIGGAPIRPSFGAIVEQPGDPATADSFFDVFVEIQMPGGGFLYNQEPLRVQADITCVPPNANYFHPVGCVRLFTSPFPGQGLHVANLTSAVHSTFPTCGDPGTGACNQPHNTPFCSDEACCSRVCELRPNCCTLEWDESCVAAAELVCNPGACCLPACVNGGVCGQFQNCGSVGGIQCLCFSVAEGGGNCAADYACATSAPCPNGTGDCPAGQVCYVNTCCDQPACGPAGCVPTAAGGGSPSTEPGVGPTAAGGQGSVAGEIPIPTPGCIITDPVRCSALNGEYHGNGTVCTPLTCAPPAVEIDHFPETTALMELQLPFGGSVPIALTGPTTVRVFFEGPNEGDANDDDANGLDDVQTEMVVMHLTGDSPFGPVLVTLNPNIPSRGRIEETANTQAGRLDLPPFAPAGTANSFFDVFFDIQVGGMHFHTAAPKRMSSVITHKPPAPGNVYENPEKIMLLDDNGNPTGFSIGAGRHIPRPPVEVDHFENTMAIMELQTPRGGGIPIALSGPTTVHVFFEGSNEGDAIDDDGNGLDEVQTEMVDMQLTGNSPFGPVVVKLSPSTPSRGRIEETANTQPGRLDLPPFAPAGTANSFFDVFFDIYVGEMHFHTETPKRMSSIITHKPPAPGNVYENPEKIMLLDDNGNPTGFSIGAGRHVPRPPVEVDHFENTTAIMELQMPNQDNVPIALAGPTTVHVFFEGTNEGDAIDNDGNGLDEVQTEMVDMQLTGNSPFGPIVVRLNPNIPSRGQIEETANSQPGRLDLPPFAPAGTANSFFDVFFEIRVGDRVLHTASPKRMSSVITHKPPAPGDTYENPEKILLLDENGNPSGISIGAGRHVPRPPVEVDHFENTTAIMELQMPNGDNVPIALAGPTTVHVFFEGSNEGDANDNDGNGLDEVQTQMVDMQLTGNSPFGLVVVRLNPAIPSRGQIEETANTQAGRLDLPPFAPAGAANSFFDVFFEVQVGDQVLHTESPKRMSSVITHKPPAPGNTYENPEKIQLFDRNGNPSGISIGAGRHVPRPPVEVDHFENTTAVMNLQTPAGDHVPIALSGPTTVHVFFEGSNEGNANDNDGNGLDEVQTEMVDMQLTGNSPFGPVVVRLNPAIPSRGQIEETANTQAGRLDLPPFAPAGTANSFFDVFFDIQVGGMHFHTANPKRMSSVITHKPPAPGNTYENPEKILLLDENGNPTGFSIGAGSHVPNPFRCGSPGTGDCYTPHSTPFCENGECCDRVCTLAPNCCTTGWSTVCAGLARQICDEPRACCLPDGRCKDLPAAVCELGGGRPQGPGSACRGDNNGNNVDDACETCPPAPATSVPRNCAIDARQPHQPGHPEVRQGWNSVDMTLPVGCSVVGAVPGDFTVSVTPPPGIAPTVSNVSVAGQTVTVTLSSVIPAQKWTCITHTPTGKKVCLGSLPADANGDRTSAPVDILDIIDNLNGVRVPPLQPYQCDIDRSNVCAPADILTEIDLLNGASGFVLWNGKTLPVCPSAP